MRKEERNGLQRMALFMLHFGVDYCLFVCNPAIYKDASFPKEFLGSVFHIVQWIFGCYYLVVYVKCIVSYLKSHVLKKAQ